MLLTPLELDIMRVLWSAHPMRVREVQYALRPKRPLAYTSVMTTLGRMYQKGILRRHLQGRAHCYTPAVTFPEARDEAVRHLVRSFFEGSEERLQDFLKGSPDPGGIPLPHAISEPERGSIDEILL
jgi:predicted transcriptional regulator